MDFALDGETLHLEALRREGGITKADRENPGVKRSPTRRRSCQRRSGSRVRFFGPAVPEAIEKAREVSLALEPEALGRFEAPSPQPLPATRGEILLKGVPDEIAPRSRFLAGRTFGFPDERSREGNRNRLGRAHHRLRVAILLGNTIA